MTTDTFTVVRGDSAPFGGTVTVTTNGVEAPYPLDNTMILRFTVKRHSQDPDSRALIRVGTADGRITIVDGPNGVIAMTIQPSDYTGALASPLAKQMACWYDLQVADANGSNVYTLAKGQFIVQPDITITEP